MLYNRITSAFHELNCHSWRCPRCSIKWSRKYSCIIKDRLARCNPENLLLLNLTTAEMTDHTQIELALQLFVRRARRIFGWFEYLKVVEYNRLQTQPHFHLILIFDKVVIPPKPEDYPSGLSWPNNMYQIFSKLWANSLYKAGAKPANIVWCQPPAGNGQQAATYAVGYVTGKSGQGLGTETPNETWKGRRLTYSKNFFEGEKLNDIWARIRKAWFPDKEIECLMPVLNPKYWEWQELEEEEWNDVELIRKIGRVSANTSWVKDQLNQMLRGNIYLDGNQFAFVV